MEENQKPAVQESPSADSTAQTKSVMPQDLSNIGLSPLEEAKTVLIENRKLLDALMDERKKIEKAAAEMLMNGRSFGGQTPHAETKEEKWRREAKIRYEGTGMDPT